MVTFIDRNNLSLSLNQTTHLAIILSSVTNAELPKLIKKLVTSLRSTFKNNISILNSETEG